MWGSFSYICCMVDFLTTAERKELLFHLSSFELRPNLEEKEDPTPGLLLLRFKSPPGQAGERKVERQCTDNDEEATQVIGGEFLDQEGVKVDVEAGHDDVEHEEAQGWGDNVFFALLLNHIKWSMGDNLRADHLNCVIIGRPSFILILAIIPIQPSIHLSFLRICSHNSYWCWSWAYLNNITKFNFTVFHAWSP